MARKEAIIMHEDHRKRVKERFLKDGIENMPDHEVLELLLFFSTVCSKLPPMILCR